MAKMLGKWLPDSALQLTVDNKTGDFAAVTNTLYTLDPAGATINVQLPTPAAGTYIVCKDMTGDLVTKTINILRAGAELIDGVAADIKIESEFQALGLYSNGTDWFKI